jgi:hypothetical protein
MNKYYLLYISSIKTNEIAKKLLVLIELFYIVQRKSLNKVLHKKKINKKESFIIVYLKMDRKYWVSAGR